MSALPAVRGLTPVAVPAAINVSIEAISRPARTFTGDFYFTHRADDRLWLAHGDVAAILRKRFEVATRKLGLNAASTRQELDTALFRRPGPASAQITLAFD